jgi:hypothetical protein
MRTSRMLLIAGIMLAGFANCGCKDKKTVAPVAKIETVDELLARVCELAADCVSATPQDIADCPANLLSQLSAGELTELDAFLALDKSTQDDILACFDTKICGRFGGSLANMSDADLMDPLRACP